MADIEIIKGADNGNPPDTLRQMYPKVNRNFKKLNDEVGANKTDADNKLDAHINSNTAHSAAQITYGANNVKQALDDVNTGINDTNDRIDNLIITSGDSSPEVADARGTFPVLGSRLDNFDEQLADIAINVKQYGAKGDGVTDDSQAFQAVADYLLSIGGGTIFCPRGNYFFENTVTLYGICTLIGAGSDIAIITGALELPVIITTSFLGVENWESSIIENITITRESGIIPAGSIGLDVGNAYQLKCRNVKVKRSAKGVNLHVYASGFFMEDCVVSSCADCYVHVTDRVQSNFSNCIFGGDTDVIPNSIIKISGSVDTIRFDNCQFNPTIAGVKYAVFFENYTNSHVFLFMSNCHIENVDHVFGSDESTPSINRILMSQNTVTLTQAYNKVFDVNDNTVLGEVILNGNIVTGKTSFINGKTINVSNNRLVGEVHFAGGSVVASNNTFYTGCELTGVFNNLVLIGNIFDGLAQVITDNSTGKKTIFGNVTSGSYKNINVLSDVIKMETPIAPVLINGWVNFGGEYGDAAYYKDSFGIVHLRGVIKAGTTAPGTIIFNLPMGYRPGKTVIRSIISGGAGTSIGTSLEISSLGDVRIGAFSAGSTFLPLDDISFPANQ